MYRFLIPGGTVLLQHGNSYNCVDNLPVEIPIPGDNLCFLDNKLQPVVYKLLISTTTSTTTPQWNSHVQQNFLVIKFNQSFNNHKPFKVSCDNQIFSS